jgi:hypothetical protein
VEELLRHGPQEDQDPDLIEPERPQGSPEREAERAADRTEFFEIVDQLYQPTPGGLAAQALAAIPPPPS